MFNFVHKAQPPAKTKILSAILTEADLEPFQRFDPFALRSYLHGDARFGFLQHVHRADMFRSNAQWAVRRNGYPLASVFFEAGSVRIDGVVNWPHEGHRLIVGSAGSGKFVGGIAPLLLEDDGCNVFMLDPKEGEGFLHSAIYRNELGDAEQGVRLLDPCGVFAGMYSDSVNPLDHIRADNPNVVSDVDKLVDALVVSNTKEQGSVWELSAKKTLRALILHVATYPSLARKGDTPTLMDVQAAISKGLEGALLQEMTLNPVADELVVRAADELAELKLTENTWRGVKLELDAHLAFLDNPGVRKTLSKTSFDVRELRTARMSLYLVLRNKEKEALGRWLRLMYTTIIDRIDRVPGRPLHVVVDEFPSLGRFDRVLTDLATQRAAGLKYHLAVQDLNQLHELYGHGWQTIVGNCSVRQFFGVNDNFTADYVSRALGQTTIYDGNDIQHPYPDSPPEYRPRFVGRELMTPSEVMNMARDEMIVFADRCARPLKLPAIRYYSNYPWCERGKLATAMLKPLNDL